MAGAHKKLDYLGAFSWLQTANRSAQRRVPRGHFGGQSGLGSQQRPRKFAPLFTTASLPPAFPTRGTFITSPTTPLRRIRTSSSSASIDNQTTASFHNVVRYGLTRKREQESLWTLSGNPESYTDYCFGPGTLGNTVTITGANGYSATGQAVLDCSTFRVQYVNNRDQAGYQGDITITPHLSGLAGFQYEDERGAEPGSTYYTPVARTNYFVPLAVHGDFKQRFFYTLGGSLEHYSLFGFQTSPRAGLNYYLFRPRSGAFSGTRILFNFGKAIREPKLTDQDDSLYNFLDEQWCAIHDPVAAHRSARPRPPCAPTKAASSRHS